MSRLRCNLNILRLKSGHDRDRLLRFGFYSYHLQIMSLR